MNSFYHLIAGHLSLRSSNDVDLSSYSLLNISNLCYYANDCLNMKYAMKQNRNNRKILVVIVVILALVLLGVGYFWWTSNQEKDHTFVNLDKPTKQEQAAGDEKKQELVNETTDSDKDSRASSSEQPNQPSAQSVSKVSTEVIITSAAQFDQARTVNDTSDDIIDIRAYMPDRYEEGTCTYTLTKGSLKVVESMPARPDVNYTICTNPEIKRSALAESGDWKLVVSYDSEAAHGESEQTIKGVK